MIMGSNMAECHPVAFRWPLKAKTDHGAVLMHVDPRFTRTSALCDIHAPIRAGTDIAFLGAIINHVINSKRWNTDPFFKEYVANYTNAATLVNPDFKDTEDLNGLFSGLSEGRQGLLERNLVLPAQPCARAIGDRSKDLHRPPAAESARQAKDRPHAQGPAYGLPDRQKALQALHARDGREGLRLPEGEVPAGCRHAAQQFRPRQDVEHRLRRRLDPAYGGGPDHPLLPACSRHLLGNIGRPGGGVLALRGHATIQGSTDIATLYHSLPGYLNMPDARKNHDTFKDFILTESVPLATSYWGNYPKFAVSYFKAQWGDAATKENDYGYDYHPKITGDHSHLPMFVDMMDGKIKGFFVMGQNPAVGGQNARFQRKALAKLDWMVVRDYFETETAAFWRNSPEVTEGEVKPADIKTEVFFLPAAMVSEMEGSFTNTQRLLQQHEKAADPPDDARSDIWFTYQLGKQLKKMYANSAKDHDWADQEPLSGTTSPSRPKWRTSASRTNLRRTRC